MADSVYLAPGLTAPETEAWENDDDVEAFLTEGSFATRFLDVPVRAVRELIEEHGGEHTDQD
ncbi:hypothetical protein [Streptomyces sp. NPDC059003]|uniref:hypothetical protein n=1 Tax=Streptomyces sp. NPDC059003 TaxID=3346691 RepID=UPI003698FC29